jgi:hypothetical protein
MYVDAESATQRDRQARQSKRGFWVLRLENAASMLYSFFRRRKRSAKNKKTLHRRTENAPAGPRGGDGSRGANVSLVKGTPYAIGAAVRDWTVGHGADFHPKSAIRDANTTFVQSKLRVLAYMTVALPSLNTSISLYCLGDVGEYDGLVGDHFGDEAE